MVPIPQQDDWGPYRTSGPTPPPTDGLAEESNSGPTTLARFWSHPAVVIAGTLAIIAALIAIGFYFGDP